MNMLLNPNTNEIITEGMFQSVTNWQSVEFVELTNCEEVETNAGFVLIGMINGEIFKSVLTQEEYFEGKCFSMEEVSEQVEMTLTEEIVKEEVETVEGVVVTTKNLFRLQTVEINGTKILDFRIEKESNLITIFPHIKHFYSTNILELGVERFVDLVKTKQKEISCYRRV